jgi:hypothetical protein
MVTTAQKLRQVWKLITQSSVPLAVMVFDHGLEHFPVRTDTPEQSAQLDKMFRDFAPRLMGVYTSTVSYRDFHDDFLTTEECLLDSRQKTD